MNYRNNLLAVLIILGATAAAHAQATFVSLGVEPHLQGISTGQTESVGGVLVVQLENGYASWAGNIWIQYGSWLGGFAGIQHVPITTPLSAITVWGLGGYSGRVSIDAALSNLAEGIVVLDVPAGVTSGQMWISGVRVAPAGSGLTSLSAYVSSGPNAMLAGTTVASVMRLIAPGLGSVSSTPGIIDGATGAVSATPVLEIQEGAPYTFAWSATRLLLDRTTSQMIRLTLSAKPPAGVTLTFPLTVTMGSGTFTLSDSNGTPSGLPLAVSNSSPSLNVYYMLTKSCDDYFARDILRIPIALNSVGPYPLTGMTITATASMAPVGPTFNADGSLTGLPIPRYAAEEVGPATLLSVTQPTSITVLSRTAMYSDYAQNLTLAAIVSGASGTAVNEGTVTFQVKDGPVPIGSPATATSLVNGAASAIYSLPMGTPVKSYTIEASYSGSQSFLATSGTGILSVTKASTLTQVSNVSTSYSVSNKVISLSASITPPVNGGSVSFQVKDGTAVLAEAAATIDKGLATTSCTLPANTPAKSYAIEASYGGTQAYESSSGRGLLIVGKARTVISMDNTSALYTPATQTINLTASVSGGVSNQGQVTFKLQELAIVASATPVNGRASAAITLPPYTLPKSYNIDGSYGGDSNFEASAGQGTLSVGIDTSLITSINLPADAARALSTLGQGELQEGYARVLALGSRQPLVFARFSLTSSGWQFNPVLPSSGETTQPQGPVLASEVSVPATAPLSAARIVVDITSSRDSGVALANPSDRPIRINAELRDSLGKIVNTFLVDLGPRGHVAKFVSQWLPDLVRPLTGTLTLTCEDQFAAISLLAETNKRGVLIYSTLPVANLKALPDGKDLILPHIVSGGGVSTQLYVMSPSQTTPIDVAISLFDDRGNALAMDFESESAPCASLLHRLEPNGVMKLRTRSDGPLRIGYAVMVSHVGSYQASLMGSAVLSFQNGGDVVSSAGVATADWVKLARLYIDIASSPRYRNAGIALVNPNVTDATLDLSLRGVGGMMQEPMTLATTLILPAKAHQARFVTELFAGRIPPDFQGVLELRSSQPVAAMSLQMTHNERGEAIYSTLPAMDLEHLSQEVLFIPQVVDGGGYKTEIVLVSTGADEGTIYINFFDDDGNVIRSPLK